MFMTRNVILILFLLVLTPVVLVAQNGKISGKVTDELTKEPIPFTQIRAVKGGQFKGGTTADFDGNYDISPLTPGAYDIEISSVGYASKKITGVTVSFETTTRLNIKLSTQTIKTKEVVVEAYKVPLISKDETSTGKKFTAADIEKLPTRNLNAVMTTAAGVYSSDDGGGLNIRGNRSGDNAVFINGVRQFGTSLPPVEAVEDLAVITGGVPAQYGDALGGIISITTKSAAKKFYGNVELETSRPFDHYNYDLVGGNVSGPLLKRSSTDSISKEKKTLLGFFGALQYNGNRDDSPSAYGYYRLRPPPICATTRFRT
jgi:Carboxypeptidase regulatory-like domain/TonB-dependent Receptor Plug Domain